MASNESIGMMEGAFFVGRNELLAWVNELLKLNVGKIEQLCTGAVYIQIMDACFPGSAPMTKVNWMAKYEHEYVNNYKVLQQVFDKNMVQKHIDVQKLIKGKYQDNLEFMQWMKRFYDLNCRGGDYNAEERRKGAKTPWDGGDRKQGPNKTQRAPPPQRQPIPKSKPAPRAKTRDDEDTQKQIAELTMTADTLEKERDFYFGKLRAIELFCEHYQDPDDPVVQQIQKVLYATDDETVTVNEDGSLTVTPIQE